MASWTIFISLWVVLGVVALLAKKHPFVSLFLAVGTVVGCVYMMYLGENGGAIVTLLATLVVLILRFLPNKRQEV